ncbi:MAG: ABC transporter substrate-binding protein, partial [Micromonosporaceae bacterium]
MTVTEGPSTRIPARAVVVTTLCALVASACGVITGGGSEGGAGSLTAAFYQPISDLDPTGPHNADQGLHLASKQIFDTLVVKDGQDYQPDLATKWEQPNPKEWVFHLREGVKFHDGKPLAAEDVKFSIERLAESESPLGPLWESLDAVEATDDSTVTIRTKEPLGGSMLANLSLLYVTPAATTEEKDFFDKPVGTGPFQVKNFVPGERLDLKANAKYWDGKPKLNTLNFRNIPEESSRVTALRSGEVDVVWNVGGEQLSQLKGADGITLDQVTSYLYYFIWFNSDQKPFDDVRVRRAMWHALDTKSVAKDLFGDTGKPATAPIPSSVHGHCKQQPYSYDPEKAKDLLAKAGHPKGFSTEMIWNTGSGPLINELADVAESSWKKVGVDVTSTRLERAEYLERLLALKWGADLQTNSVISGDADYTLGRLYTTAAKRNGFGDPKLDRLLMAARESTDQQERAELYCKANKIIWDNAVGVFPVDLLMTYARSE